MRKVVGICRGLEKEASSLRARRDEDAQTISQLQAQLREANASVADA